MRISIINDILKLITRCTIYEYEDGVKKKLEKKKKNALKYYDKFLKESEKQNRKK